MLFSQWLTPMSRQLGEAMKDLKPKLLELCPLDQDRREVGLNSIFGNNKISW